MALPLEKKPMIVRRRLQKLGGSRVLVIPAEWLEQYDLKEGDQLTMIANRHLKVLAPDAVDEVYEKVTEMVKEGE